jgi:hypothetical protein
MNLFFTISYVLLFAAILFETLVIYGALQKVIWFEHFYKDSTGRDQPREIYPPVSSAPQFSLPLMQPGKTLSTSNLQGQTSLLCFVSPKPTQSFQTLLAALHAWWHRMEGRVYLVCSGADAVCRHFVDEYANGFPSERVVCDEAGILARDFEIRETPMAVELDADTQVVRYGCPESFELGHRDDRHTEFTTHPAWPDNRPMSGAGFARVDSTISCVLSRFRLNSPLSVVPFYFAFRRVRQASREIDGLLEAVFLFEDLRTCYTLSFWKDDWSIVEFGRVRAHIDAANSAFSATYKKDAKRSEIWSAQFRLWAVSCHNLDWKSLDMKAALGEQWRRREELAKKTINP